MALVVAHNPKVGLPRDLKTTSENRFKKRTSVSSALP
jgi:hypothetical protein